MSNVYIDEVNDANGDLVDIIYYHAFCAPPGIKPYYAPEPLDYPVYCGESGSGCGGRVPVPLTEVGKDAEYERITASGLYDDDDETRGNH